MRKKIHFPEPIAALAAEHQVILARLKALSEAIGSEEAADVGGLAELVKSFTDALDAHVRKEETLLFPCIRDALEIMEVEHACVASLRSEFARLATVLNGDSSSALDNGGHLAWVSMRAAEILKAHIYKEDNVLYPLASQVISEEKLAGLVAGVRSMAAGNVE